MIYDISHRNMNILDEIPLCTQLIASHNNITTLTSISHLPLSHLDVSFNKLQTIIGCPPSVTHLRVSNNVLIDLNGCPPNLLKLGCSHTHITSFKGISQKVTHVTASSTFLTSFMGLPETMELLFCTYNNISLWNGCPKVRHLDVSVNPLGTFYGCPDGIEELTACSISLTSLEYCPSSVTILRINGNNIKTIDEFYQLIDRCPKLRLLSYTNRGSYILEAEFELLKKTYPQVEMLF